ncbi:MAG: 2,3,4,5-tetrahydropyridine-2,6-dicarboxylate N-succinyltransferase [Bradymonadaceae bacterium]
MSSPTELADNALLERIDALYEHDTGDVPDDAAAVFEEFLDRLEGGRLRAAEPDPSRDGWTVNREVKRGILFGFRIGELREFHDDSPLQFSDKHTFPPQRLPVAERNIRLVPGGSAVRRGAFLGENVTVMPPAYVNVGAHVGADTMVDSHALVGSCAQIGDGVHLSSGAQIGGVLEPVGQRPVVVEDDALVGGNTGLYEGVHVCEGAVIGAGCVVTASTPVYDLPRETVHSPSGGTGATIPPRAVVVPGTRPASGDFAEQHGVQLSTPVIVKYRDEQTDAQTALEDALR